MGNLGAQYACVVMPHYVPTIVVLYRRRYRVERFVLVIINLIFLKNNNNEYRKLTALVANYACRTLSKSYVKNCGTI